MCGRVRYVPDGGWVGASKKLHYCMAREGGSIMSYIYIGLPLFIWTTHE